MPLSDILKKLGPDQGTEQEPGEERSPDEILTAVRESVGILNRMDKRPLAKYIRRRWDRWDTVYRRMQTELKVNHARYDGDTFAQVDPFDPDRVYIPYGTRKRKPPVLNKIRRTVHRYMAQVTADEPIIEGVPANHTDEARDAAEAATDALRGEWHRMSLQRRLQKAIHLACVYRSAFWFFEWDDTAGGRVPAQKFFVNAETGDRELHFVDGAGNKVEEEEDAATIWQGNLAVDVMTPFNVRWSGGDYAHEGDEVMVAKMVTLQQAYDMEPKLKKVKVTELLKGVPQGAQQWLNDIRGAGGWDSKKEGYPGDDITGEKMSDTDSRLDAPVFLLHYFKKPTRDYRSGFHAISVGEHLVHRGPLQYGVVPVVQFKLIDDPKDPLGIGLVDLLKDPQELLDFVNAQILRFLQSMRRRWFVPLMSGVSKRDLLNPTRSVIPYNPAGGAPTPESPGELPRSLTNILERFDQEFDDEAGIHDIMQGKHVPGVQSGRHAEALRSGDETILGLTRTQVVEGLEHAGVVMLETIKKEWKSERQVSYFQGREYMETAFKGTDFRDTKAVRLRPGTLLLLTPAQKLETLFGYAEMGAITQQELRQLAPLSDTAGISVTEDPHYQKARRENHRFIKGPPEELTEAREQYELELSTVERQVSDIQRLVGLGYGSTPEGQEDLQAIEATMRESMQAIEGAWQAELAKYLPQVEQWESDPAVAQVHMTEHMATLAKDKVRRMPEWWVQPFQQHLAQHQQVVQQAQAAAQPQQQGGQPQPQQ